MMNEHERETSETLSKAKLVLVGFLIVAAYFLITEHQAHMGGALYYLPFLLLLGCPLILIFMHSGHGGHGKGDPHSDNEKGDA